MKSTLTIVAAVSLAAASFTAGWVINGWRVGKNHAEEQITVEQDKTAEAVATIAKVDTKLKEVITKTEQAATTTTQTLAQLELINDATNRQSEQITATTQRLKNEIDKLGPAKCVFSIDYGRVWKGVGEAANSNRHTLYGTQNTDTD